MEEIENSTGSEIIEEIKEEDGDQIVGWVKIFKHYSSKHFDFKSNETVWR